MIALHLNLLLLAAGSAAAAPAPGDNGRLDCMILPHQVVQIGVGQPGVLQSVTVERGDIVRRGQVLAEQQSDVERASLALAHARARQQGDHDAARGATELADRDLDRALALQRDQFVSANYVDRQRAEAQVAQGRLTAARERVTQSRREVDLAAAQLAQRIVRAPIDGVVVDRLAQPGEFVDQKPILRLAAIDPLRVDVLVPATQFGRIAAGAFGTVYPELLQPTPRRAVVTQVDRVIDGASNTFRVRLELPNPDGALPAGLRCQVALGVAPPAAEAPPKATGAAPAGPMALRMDLALDDTATAPERDAPVAPVTLRTTATAKTTAAARTTASAGSGR